MQGEKGNLSDGWLSLDNVNLETYRIDAASPYLNAVNA
jgi:hypothetical protein